MLSQLCSTVCSGGIVLYIVRPWSVRLVVRPRACRHRLSAWGEPRCPCRASHDGRSTRAPRVHFCANMVLYGLASMRASIFQRKNIS